MSIRPISLLYHVIDLDLSNKHTTTKPTYIAHKPSRATYSHFCTATFTIIKSSLVKKISIYSQVSESTSGPPQCPPS